MEIIAQAAPYILAILIAAVGLDVHRVGKQVEKNTELLLHLREVREAASEIAESEMRMSRGRKERNKAIFQRYQWPVSAVALVAVLWWAGTH